MFNYGILPLDEWDRLKELCGDAAIPSPETSQAVVAEKDGKLAGVLFVQLAVHAEPLILRDPAVNWLKLQVLAEQLLTDSMFAGYYAMSADPHVERMAEIAGLTRLDYKVWRKDLWPH